MHFWTGLGLTGPLKGHLLSTLWCMKVPWLSLHPSLVTWNTFPLACLPMKVPFSHAVMVQCAELGDISGPLPTGGGECRHDYASLLETIISAGSIERPTPWLIKYAASVRGWRGVCRQLHQAMSEQLRWMIACCVRRSALQWDAVSEEDQWVDAVLKWRLQLQAS